jgi:hypothetical protein
MKGRLSSQMKCQRKTSQRRRIRRKVLLPALRYHDPEPEMDDLDDLDFWVPPVGSRWDDDGRQDRWESSPGNKDAAENDGASGICKLV